MNARHRRKTDSLIYPLGRTPWSERCFKVYRQFKMYNDPTLNPQLYAPLESNFLAEISLQTERNERKLEMLVAATALS